MTSQPTFCSNILPGASWAEHFEALKASLPTIQTGLQDQGLPCLSHLGLRLGRSALSDLQAPEQLVAFKEWLAEHQLAVYLINGFPYGQFHGSEVKDQVHQPDWTSTDRLIYTQELATLLVALQSPLTQQQKRLGISTSPISYRPWYADSPGDGWVAMITGARQLAEWTWFAAQLESNSGFQVVLEVEPEPDGMLDTLATTVDFFKEYLWQYGKEHLMSLANIDEAKSMELLKRHVQVCFDVCHVAVEYEKPALVLQTLLETGIGIGRVQISAALEAVNLAGLQQLQVFNEPVYLHQARVLREGGHIRKFSDLGPALDWCGANVDQWHNIRTHYHVPLATTHYDDLLGTQPAIVETLEWLSKNEMLTTIPLEIETYTWQVLPQALQQKLTISIVGELVWLHHQLAGVLDRAKNAE